MDGMTNGTLHFLPSEWINGLLQRMEVSHHNERESVVNESTSGSKLNVPSACSVNSFPDP